MDKSILEIVHESAQDLYDVGLVNLVTMRHFSKLCSQLPKIKELDSSEIKKIREHEKLSQPVFAHLLNVSPSTIKQWEIGEKQPSGAALKLLNMIAQKGAKVML